MLHGRRLSPLAIDLSQLGHHTVTSFYSNLITRPTGRAVRMGVESQIAEVDAEQHVCLSILDFTQVRILDFSCADEIVAKLLLRYTGGDRPAEAYFLARGLQEHHREAVEAVLERHDLLLAVEPEPGSYDLLGPSDAVQRRCWKALLLRSRCGVEHVTAATGLSAEAVEAALGALVEHRVAVPLRDGTVCAIPTLVHATSGHDAA
jgi:hypothetical protein